MCVCVCVCAWPQLTNFLVDDWMREPPRVLLTDFGLASEWSVRDGHEQRRCYAFGGASPGELEAWPGGRVGVHEAAGRPQRRAANGVHWCHHWTSTSLAAWLPVGFAAAARPAL
jgi:hypothetical protein